MLSAERFFVKFVTRERGEEREKKCTFEILSMIFPMTRSSLIQHGDTFSHEHIDTSYSSEHPSTTFETNAKRYFDISPEDFRSGYMCVGSFMMVKHVRDKSYTYIYRNNGVTTFQTDNTMIARFSFVDLFGSTRRANDVSARNTKKYVC